MSTFSEANVEPVPSLIPSKRLDPSVEEEHSSDDKKIVEKYNYIEEQDALPDYDSEEEYGLSPEDRKEYYRLINESEGYDCGLFNGYEPGMILEASERWYDRFIGYVHQALADYNKNEGTRLDFYRIVKANLQIVAVVMYYVTFEVKDMGDGGAIRTFQTRIWEKVKGFKVQQFRPKPTAA